MSGNSTGTLDINCGPSYFNSPTLILLNTNQIGPLEFSFHIKSYTLENNVGCFKVVDTKFMWIDGEVAVSGEELEIFGS